MSCHRYSLDIRQLVFDNNNRAKSRYVENGHTWPACVAETPFSPAPPMKLTIFRGFNEPLSESETEHFLRPKLELNRGVPHRLVDGVSKPICSERKYKRECIDRFFSGTPECSYGLYYAHISDREVRFCFRQYPSNSKSQSDGELCFSVDQGPFDFLIEKEGAFDDAQEIVLIHFGERDACGKTLLRVFDDDGHRQKVFNFELPYQKNDSGCIRMNVEEYF